MASSNFNLGQSVESYVNRIAGEGSLTGSDSEELKAHLFDATEELQYTGLTEEEAFIVACKRLGNARILDEEYSKVNGSIRTSRIWAYLLIGFNLFYAIPTIIHWILPLFYRAVYIKFEDSGIAVSIVTGVHVLLCVLIGYIVKQKNSIAKFIEAHAQTNSALMLCISFIPFGLAYLSKFIWVPKFSAYFGNSLGELFNSSLVENSYYLIFITMAAGALTLVFTVDKPARFTLKSLFEKPSVLFLILFGIFTETAAGFTRVIRIDNIIFKGLMFGLIYLIAAYIITYHNKQSTVKYLLWFSVIGIGAETISGIIADISQRQHNTMYFVLSAIICVLIGRFIALKTSAKAEIVKV